MKGRTMTRITNLRTATILSTFTLVAALGAGAAIAADNGNASKLPHEVKSASIQVLENTETQADLARLARVSKQVAEAAALDVQPGQVVKARLDDEAGYLVWKIDVKHGKGTTEFAVDAGNAKVLAAEDDEQAGRDKRS
jgi:uncharacterized membrane protein YkoI